MRVAFAALPDERRGGNNQRYTMADAGLSAFSVFFTQSPSFLDYQTRMRQASGRDNTQSLFGVHEIPSDNQIRNLLDPVPEETAYPLLADLGEDLYREGYLDGFRSVGDTLLLALDGTDFFSAEKLSCPCCLSATQKNGKVRYRHTAVTPVLVAPGKEQVIALAPEFVVKQDGSEKQDCELAAACRWLDSWSARYAAWRITLLGDDLYCHQPFCERALSAGFAFLFTCKPDSHNTLYEWVADFERNGDLQVVTRMRQIGKRRFTDTYRYAHQLPLRDADDALMVNWLELITTDSAGKVIYRNAWATSHRIDDDNVKALAEAGRARWKIENEGNNVLKTKGYHFEHNFGHGKKHLANLLATLILLAYLVHTALDWVDDRYRQVRDRLPSRRTFFEHLRALLLYLPFDGWDELMAFMLDKLRSKTPDTG
jgi:hypothetical protein